MMATPLPPRPHPDVRWKRTGRTGILLNLSNGEYFEIDEHGLAIWRRLDGRTPVAAIAAALAAYYRASPRIVARDVEAFVARLKKRQLVETQPARRPRVRARP